MNRCSTALRLFSVCATLALTPTGCHSVPKRDALEAKNSEVDASGVKSAEAASTAAAKATPAELTAIMNEVQQLGALDPAAQNALIEDLKKTDPALWPQLMQTF